VEAVKAGLIYDPRLFELFEADDLYQRLDEIICRSVLIKKEVVEQDEKEEHLRKILNFGHTLGHGLESYFELSEYLHGECVAMGMLPMLEDKKLQQRALKVFAKLSMPAGVDYDKEAVYQLMNKDKKKQGNRITIVKVPCLGKYRLDNIKTSQLRDYLTGD
jgi:3-dehydroquinate synthase